MTTQATHELDVRVKILNSLLTCPHRDVKNLVTVHEQMFTDDPLFYGHLGVWAQKNTVIRDHHELFIAKMFLSDIQEQREAAFVLLQNLAPYQVNNVIDHIKGKSILTKESGKVYEKRFGQNLPRIFRSAVQFYLETRESNKDWFDTAAIKDKQSLKSLYCRARISPGTEHVRAVLFNEGEVDPNSKYGRFKSIRKEEDPQKQATLIIQEKIPFTSAVSLVKKVTPEVLVALINNMTHQELLNNLNSLQKKGVMKNPDLKQLIDRKIEEAKKTTSKVDTLKASQALKSVKIQDEVLAESIQQITEERLKKTRIKKPTALLVDKSGSMESAIEAAKHVGSLISSICDSDFYCYAFDNAAVKINTQVASSKGWETALKGVKANGGTAIGAPLPVMIRNNEKVEQIVVISDFEETNAPRFLDELAKYSSHFGSELHVVCIQTSPTNGLGNSLRNILPSMRNISHDVYNLTNQVDYYSLPNLLNFLTRPGKTDLVQEIFETPLPTKEQSKK